MSIFYKVRVKIMAPTFKVQFIDGIYSAHDIIHDTETAKKDIAHQIMTRFGAQHISGAIVEVVLFRRSDIGFILSESSEELDKK